jgi:hypothetical protein
LMHLDMKLAGLERLYGLYEETVDGSDLACKKGCAHCCTVNVTLTSLEGFYTVSQMTESEGTIVWQHLEAASRGKRFQPGYSTNALAQVCLDGGQLPEEENDPQWGQCPVLTDLLCPLYRTRPFGCRCMVSNSNCGNEGFASMSDWVMTLNQVFCQFIEHLDAGGFSGNFTDVLLYMKSEDNRLHYQIHGPMAISPPFVANRPIPVLMVPPEHQERLAPILDTIREIFG